MLINNIYFYFDDKFHNVYQICGFSQFLICWNTRILIVLQFKKMNRKISRKGENAIHSFNQSSKHVWRFRFSSCARYRSRHEEYRECFEFSESENCAGFDRLIDTVELTRGKYFD